MTGSEIIVNCLIEQEVDTVFGFPGGYILDVYDALYQYGDSITHILTAHEQGAIHAADGYARASGKPGVVIATSGPGATNLVTGLATAYADSVPLVAITGNAPRSLLGKDSFQEVDITGMTISITKYNTMVHHIDELESVLQKAFLIAQDGRPGPVLIDIPKDITRESVDYIPATHGPQEVVQAAADHILMAADLLKRSKKPLVYLGNEMFLAGAENSIMMMANKIDARVVCSLMGLAAYNHRDPHCLGLLEKSNTAACQAIEDCDLLIAIGTGLTDNVFSELKIKGDVLQIDIDQYDVNMNIPTNCMLTGDIQTNITELINMLNVQHHTVWSDAALVRECDKEYADGVSVTYIKCLLRMFNDLWGDQIVVCCDSSEQLDVARWYPFCIERSFLTSAGLKTAGYHLGAAIGAWFARKDKKIVAISSEEGFHRNCMELVTLVKYQIPAIVVILRKSHLTVADHGRMEAYQCEYEELAKAYGLDYFYLRVGDEMRLPLSKAMHIQGPVLLECDVE